MAVSSVRELDVKVRYVQVFVFLKNENRLNKQPEF